MADNEQKPQETPKDPVNPQPPQAPAQVAKPKSYTERFIEMERAIEKLIYVVNFHTKTIESTMHRLDMAFDRLEEMNMVRKSVNAMMKLSVEAQVLSLENVSKKIVQLEHEAAEEQLQLDIKEGLVAATETAETPNDIIDFVTLPEDESGLATLGSFPEETQQEIKGKKAGDVVEKAQIKIKAVYRYNLQMPPIAQPTQEAASGEATQPQS